MSFQQIFDNLVRDTVELSLPAFGPELVLCGTIVLMLLVRVFNLGRGRDAFWIALAGSVAALVLAAPWQHLQPGAAIGSREIFTGLLIYDPFTVFFRSLLLFFAVLFVLFTRLSGIPDREDGPDFYTLVLGATIGMSLMASANHLLMVFLAIEMASVPSYVLAGMLKGRRESSEAALKYAVYGAGASGVLLYGISLLAGVLGSVHLPTMAVQLAELISAGAGADRAMVLVLGALMVGAGLAFKLSAVPFHFWCPDVFEGAAAEVNAFLSVASKAAALALLVRVTLGFASADLPLPVVQAAPAVALTPVAQQADHDHPAAEAEPAAPLAPGSDALAPVRGFLTGLITLIAAVTCTFGNLAAYGQTNIKRLLAYSTIAHAGYMMMPVAAAVALAGDRPEAAEAAVASLCFYAGVYLFMNLGAFAVVAFLRNELRSEEIADYAGLVRRSPGMAVCFSVLLLSLLGVPPLAGFAAKFAIFGALVDARLWLLLAIGGINTVLSLFYYLRVVKVMTLDPEPAGRTPHTVPLTTYGGMYVAAVSLPVVILGIGFSGLHQWALAAASKLLG